MLKQFNKFSRNCHKIYNKVFKVYNHKSQVNNNK